MALVVLASLHGAPGTTTLAVALGAAWARGAALLVEADPSGGVLAARFGLSVDPGLTSLAGRARRGLDATDVDDAAHVLPGGLAVVVADPGAEVTSAALEAGGRILGTALAGHPGDVLVDAGRLVPGSPAHALLDQATLLVLVCRPRVDELAVVARRLPSLADRRDTVVAVVGERPYRSDEVAAVLGVDVVGVVADDPKAAAALGGRAGSSQRSGLLKSAETVATRLAERLGQRAADPWWADA